MTQETDQAKTSGQILAEEVGQGLDELRRPAPGLLLSGFSAGLDIGFSVFFMAVALTLVGPDASPLLKRFVLGNAYTVGFVFVILGRSELFTEHATLAVFPVLSGRATFGQLGRLWALIYVSNLVGTVLFSAFVVTLGPRLGVITPAAFTAISRGIVDHQPSTIVLSAVAAGWLMGLLSWLVAASQETVSRVVVVWLITFCMGFVGFHHCIVGSVEVMSGVMIDPQVTLADYGTVLAFSTLGNILGGVALVAGLKYSHSVRRQ